MAKSKGPTRPTSRVGRPKTAVDAGRYTAPVPRSVRRSPVAFGVIILVALAVGLLIILLNYLTVVPGGTSPWYLVVGLVIIFAGFLMATRYR